MAKRMSQRVKAYTIGAVLGVLAGVILSLVQPTVWKGTALVHIGQRSNLGAQPIEDALTAVERIRSRAFVQSAAERAKGESTNGWSADDVDVSVTPVRNSDSISIAVEAKSAELAKLATAAIVDELLSKHDAILARYQAGPNSEISNLDLEMDRLSKLVSSMPNNRTEIILLQHDLDWTRRRASELRQSVSSMNMQPTSLLEPVSITERRAFSSPWRACLFGLAVGLFVAVIWDRRKGKR